MFFRVFPRRFGGENAHWHAPLSWLKPQYSSSPPPPPFPSRNRFMVALVKLDITGSCRQNIKLDKCSPAGGRAAMPAPPGPSRTPPQPNPDFLCSVHPSAHARAVAAPLGGVEPVSSAVCFPRCRQREVSSVRLCVRMAVPRTVPSLQTCPSQ